MQNVVVESKSGNELFAPAYVIGQMQNKIIYNLPVKTGANAFRGMLETDSLPRGILHFTVFNKNDKLLEERLCFVKGKDVVTDADRFTNK